MLPIVESKEIEIKKRNTRTKCQEGYFQPVKMKLANIDFVEPSVSPRNVVTEGSPQSYIKGLRGGVIGKKEKIRQFIHLNNMQKTL